MEIDIDLKQDSFHISLKGKKQGNINTNKIFSTSLYYLKCPSL